MSDPRDTQFAGFAAMLLKQLDDAVRDMNGQEVSEQDFAGRLGLIIARRAYDLVRHALHYHEDSALYACSLDNAVNAVPDMATWPEEQSK